MIFMLSKISILISGIGFGVLAILAIFGANYAFESHFLLFDPIFGVLTLILVFAHGSFVQFYTNFKQKQMIKGQFGTYLSPEMVEMLAKDPSLMKLGGERKEMTFLFMDICGFTPISEFYKNNDDPEGLVHLINEYLNEMTNIILQNGGTIDKYMGDCIMAFWNAPLPCDNHAELAVKSAVEIEAKTNELKEIYRERGLPDINVGTGVNTGDCIVGNMGSESRFDYSVIGDAVNLAARLEATAARGDYKEYKTIISSFTNDLIDIPTESIGMIKVKGKDEEIEIFTPSYK
jgi:adenylate cyclase